MHVEGIDPAFGHWFAGFVDGEGCFFLSRNHMSYNGTPYITYSCGFTLGLRGDDEPSLLWIRDTLGMGTIRRHEHTTNTSNPSVALRIERKPDIVAFAPFFDRFPLRSKKARDYAIWRRAVDHWDTNHRKGRSPKGTRPDWTVMAAFHEELKAVRKYA